ncbi:hypothetical protein A9Q91_00580 [Candidatus Gracilibacteria bacterium 28_42_T64]|nr:hypothetical protein A9Q91_00580 [Candidatus Gracilibacteria bacterium 28_42_T64]
MLNYYDNYSDREMEIVVQTPNQSKKNEYGIHTIKESLDQIINDEGGYKISITMKTFRELLKNIGDNSQANFAKKKIEQLNLSNKELEAA